ncbi:MAG: PAS domain S-box protein [Cyanobacteria bacterium J06641_5]
MLLFVFSLSWFGTDRSEGIWCQTLAVGQAEVPSIRSQLQLPQPVSTPQAASLGAITVLSADLLPLTAIAMLLAGAFVWDNRRLRQQLAEDEKHAATSPILEGSFRQTLMDAPFPMMVHAEDGEVLQVNAAWTEITGYARTDIPTVRDWAMLAYGDRATAILETRIARKYSFDTRLDEGELAIATCDGRQRIWNFSTAPLGKLSDGRRVVVSMAADVTQRQQAEAAARAKEAHYRGLFAGLFGQTAVGIAYATADGQFVDVNSRLCELLGYSREELLSKSIVEITHPDDRSQIKPAAKRLWAGEITDFFQEKRYLRKDGSCWWSATSVSLVRDEADNPRHSLAVICDISDRKATETALRRSEERWFLAVSGSDDGIWDRSLVSHEHFLSPRYLEIVGYPDEEVDTFEKWLDLLHPQDRERAWATFQKHLKGEVPRYACEYRVRCKDGQYKWLLARGKAIRDDTGAPIRVVGSIADIGDRKSTEEALRASEERYRLLAESANDLVCLHDPDGRYLFVSPSCKALLGYHQHEMVGHDPYEFVHPEDCDRVRKEAHDSALLGKLVPVTYRIRTKSGAYIWLETLTNPIQDSQERTVQLQTTSRNITERVNALELLVHEARHDTLTGLPNRTLLIERLEYCLQAQARDPQQRFAVLFLDLDRFKVINDSLGHPSGDRVLVAIANKLNTLVRGTDLAARLGGDEFVVLLANTPDVRDAVRVAERLLEELQTPIELGGREVVVGASIGIVFGDMRYTCTDEVLRDADLAMYRAKEQHGIARKVSIFNAEMHARALQRLNLEGDLRAALKRQEFQVEYQPIIELATGQIACLEALVRWQHPQQGRVSPEKFIPIAEETGTIVPLDRWVLETACQSLVAWRKRYPRTANLRIGVNFCSRDLQARDFLSDIDCLLASLQLNGHCLTVEITERILVANFSETIALLEQLKARDIHLSIDDFGTGYSSLAYLHQLPVDSLKIDRTFVSQMQSDRRSHEIVETIVTLSNRLGIEAIAEGIETQQQLDLLARLGCEFGQGYHFTKPMPAEALEVWFQASTAVEEI